MKADETAVRPILAATRFYFGRQQGNQRRTTTFRTIQDSFRQASGLSQLLGYMVRIEIARAFTEQKDKTL